MIVPALTLVTQLTVNRAVATSLFVISLNGASGVLSGLLTGRDVPWLVTGLFVGGGILGPVIGQ